MQMYRKMGLLFALFFFLGFAINFFSGFIQTKSILMTFSNTILHSLLTSTVLFLLSSISIRLKWLQVSVFIIMTPIAIIRDPKAIYGLGFFAMAILLLVRYGFYDKNRVFKIILSSSYLILTEFLAVFFSRESLFSAIAPSYYISGFIYFLFLIYKEKLVVYLRKPKPLLSLKEKGLSSAERSFVLLVLSGKTQKEIAIEFELSESTIRNTLARAYKKLGVVDMVSLAILGERNEITE
ncbi:hypothetical protein MASR2M29_15070 [Spirochaetota bacterium]